MAVKILERGGVSRLAAEEEGARVPLRGGP